MTPPNPQPLLRELARIKVLFQARAVAAAMGLPQHVVATQGDGDDNA